MQSACQSRQMGINMKKLMTMHIDCKETHEVKCEDAVYRQILFGGYAEGEYFDGKILQGGVDTQEEFLNGTGTLSARYMLEGTDMDGQKCMVYVENQGTIGGDVTKPVLHTDSKALNFVHHAKLTGRIKNVNGELQIDIFILESKQEEEDV